MTIVTINGFATGDGLECALICDVRITEVYTKLAVPEMVVNLLCCGRGVQTLPWFTGKDWIKRMIPTDGRAGVQTVPRIGLVEEVAEAGATRETAIAMVLRVTALSPQAITFGKQLIHQARDGVPRGAVLVAERECFVDLFGYPDQCGDVNAFLGKYTPR